MDTTYAIVIKKIDDTLGATKFAGLDLDEAEELLEGLWQGTEPREEWAGLAIIDEYADTIYSELEW
jgi:hypothetical protein